MLEQKAKIILELSISPRNQRNIRKHVNRDTVFLFFLLQLFLVIKNISEATLKLTLFTIYLLVKCWYRTVYTECVP